MVDHLCAHGDEVTVVSMARKPDLLNLLDNLDPGLLNALRRLDVDVLVEDELGYQSLCLLNRRLRKEVPFPLVSIVHHLSCLAERSGPMSAALRTLERNYLATVDGFIYNSRATRDAVRSFRPDAGGVVACPGKDHFAVPAGERRDLSGPLRAVYLGNILPHKGLDVLVEAIALLPTGSVTLDVIGAEVDPAFCSGVREQAATLGLGETVRFHGYVDEGAKEILLSRGHVLAVPSYHEGYGLVFVEAMAHGLPVIAPRSGGAGEIVTDGEEGFLVEAGDRWAIAEALSSLQDQITWRRMSARASERFGQLPTWEEGMSEARGYLHRIASEGLPNGSG
jgi:glycosyltransferase involved in cell wall biosynthesis